MTIDIPDGDTCEANCWWYVEYDPSGVSRVAQPTDRTVWTARVIDNPVRLVPNAP